jgi:hypothetical protein
MEVVESGIGVGPGFMPEPDGLHLYTGALRRMDFTDPPYTLACSGINPGPTPMPEYTFWRRTINNNGDLRPIDYDNRRGNPKRNYIG